MGEEDNKKVVEDNDEEVTVSPAEEKARQGGWVPVEEWRGDPDDWVDHKLFNMRGEFFDRIQSQSGVIKTLNAKIEERESALKDMATLTDKIAAKAYKDAMKDLKEQKLAALEANDYSGVIDIDEEIEDLKDQKPKATEDAPEATQAPDIPPEVEAWMKQPENQWYHKDSTMRAMADGLANSILAEHEGIAPSALLEQVDSAMRKELPHKFTKQTVADVGDGGDYSASAHRKNKSLPKFGDLDEDQQAVCRKLVKIGTFDSNKEYIEALQKAGDI